MAPVRKLDQFDVRPSQTVRHIAFDTHTHLTRTHPHFQVERLREQIASEWSVRVAQIIITMKREDGKLKHLKDEKSLAQCKVNAMSTVIVHFTPSS
jgi:hypothetical protein